MKTFFVVLRKNDSYDIGSIPRERAEAIVMANNRKARDDQSATGPES